MKLALPILLCLALALSAAQPVNLSQIVSANPNYPGVMVNTGGGWVQAHIDGTLQIISNASGTTLHVVGGGAGVPGPPGPMGPAGPQGIQGVQGIQGIQGPAAPTLPITVSATGGIAVKDLTVGTTGTPSVFVLTKADKTTCTLAVQATGAVTCQ